MAYHLSISIRLKTRAEIQPILDALEPVGIYPDEDDIYRKGGFSYVDHLAWNLFYSKERIDALIQALIKLEPEPSRRPQLKCVNELAMIVWGYVITPHEAIPYRGVMRRDRRDQLSKSIPRIDTAGSRTGG